MTDTRPPDAVSFDALLHEFADGDPELARLGAYELGRHAVAAKIDIIEIVRAYHLALARAFVDRPPADQADLIERSGELLSESLMSYQMTHAGYQDTNLALRENHARFQAILDHTPAIVALKALDGRYLLVNRQFEQVFGIAATTVTGQTDDSLFGAARLAEMFNRSTAGLRERGTEAFEDTIETAAGTRTFLTIRFFIPDASGVPSSVCTISTDITDRVQAEQDREAARHRADAANAAKSDFLSRMSHELRTPLNAVLGFAQLLQLEVDVEDHRRYADDIFKAGRHLLDLINEVLDIAGIEAGRTNLNLVPVELNSVVHAAIALIRPSATDRDITIDVAELPSVVVRADRQRLTQVLLNLLSNAVKYNRVGGRIEIRAHEPDTHRFGIAIRDTGPGIDPARLGDIFAPFERLGAEFTDIEGTGIGLAVTKDLVEQMGGAIEVASRPGHGSTFTIALPTVLDQSSSPATITTAPGPATPDGPDLDVLYIEDNAVSVRLMQRILARRPNITMRSTARARHGVDLATEHPPDLLLLDLNLPRVSGTSILRDLRANPATAGITIAVVTADATTESREALRRLGADHYFTKPIDIDEILDLVDQLAERKAREES